MSTLFFCSSQSIHISNSFFKSSSEIYFSGFSFLSSSNNSNMSIFNLLVLLLLLIQYLFSQSSACHETANHIISFSHFNISSYENSGTSTNSNFSSKSLLLSNNHI
ncbi:MAG: hypothetical protein Q8S84_06550 [bacterium]|nr:hypothetical protein [bacterium]MDP3381125.1 hypothetical protein [bacterium]